jgi:hypothetical protein
MHSIAKAAHTAMTLCVIANAPEVFLQTKVFLLAAELSQLKPLARSVSLHR